MLKLYRKMGPMAGGSTVGRGTEGLISPKYQATPVVNPISDLRCPNSGNANIKASPGKKYFRLFFINTFGALKTGPH